MRRIITPTQISIFAISELAAELEELTVRKKFKDKIPPKSELAKQLIKDGKKHEESLIESFQNKNNEVVNIGNFAEKERIKETKKAMINGVSYIYQASLKNNEIKGSADVLKRIDEPSNLGNWSYIPIECKLSSTSKTTFIIQSCAYCDLLGDYQGQKASQFELYLGGMNFKRFETKKYWNWYSLLKKRYKKFIENFNEDMEIKFIPGNHGKWTDYVTEKLKKNRDLIIVAGMTQSQRLKLIKKNIKTIDDFAALKPENKIFGSKKDTLRNLYNQAKIQVRPRSSDGKPNIEPRVWKNSYLKEGKIKNIMPLRDDGDVWFDMEGFNDSVKGIKLEYLFGACYEKNGKIEFKKWWAHDHAQEAEAFENWVNWIEARRIKYPKLHIYHYANYEKDAMRKLQQKHPNSFAVKIIDDWLREDLMVDLLPIVKNAIFLGEESYSIKKVEKLYKEERKTL